MLAIMGHMVVLCTALGMLMVLACRWAIPSHLHHIVHETRIQAGNITNIPKVCGRFRTQMTSHRKNFEKFA